MVGLIILSRGVAYSVGRHEEGARAYQYVTNYFVTEFGKFVEAESLVSQRL